MPGPNVINLGIMLGGRYFGIKGALVALAGLLTAPLFVVLILALLYAHYSSVPAVAGALRGMGAVAAGLIVATGLKLMSSLKKNAIGLPLCSALGVLCFVAVALLRWPLIYVLAGLGGLGCFAAYRALKPALAVIAANPSSSSGHD